MPRWMLLSRRGQLDLLIFRRFGIFYYDQSLETKETRSANPEITMNLIEKDGRHSSIKTKPVEKSYVLLSARVPILPQANN